MARFRRRLRNYTSDGDDAGGHGDRSDGGQRARNAEAQGETIANRPDRVDGGGGFSG